MFFNPFTECRILFYHMHPTPLIQQRSTVVGSGVALACKTRSICQGLGFVAFHSTDRLSFLIYPHKLLPQSSGINPGKWEGLLPSRCYSFPGVQVPGHFRIRPIRCQSVIKKNNKWLPIKRMDGCEVRSESKVRGREKKQDEIKEQDGEQAERRESWFGECEPCWNHSAQISTMCPPEPYYPINELYWGNKVLWSSAKTLKGPRLSQPGAKRSPAPRGTNEKKKKRGPWPRVRCPRCSLASCLSNGLLVTEK